ncbi:hypothetical protein [Streptomyces sp. NPDC090445]|uniref:hypothetical protein n=1 Tax=Streptomyces sp. NPDC090445 TaxID=3365963 RepID=UPI00382E79C0
MRISGIGQGCSSPQNEAPAGPEIIAPRRPTRVDLNRPGSGTDPDLMERLERQILGPRD